MTNPERIRAFSMRLEGDSFEDIGRAVGYCAQYVQQDLKNCIKSPPRQPKIRYPAIRRLVVSQYGGSIRRFSVDCGLSENTLHAVFKGLANPGKPVVDAILQTTGMTYEQAFAEEEAT